MKNIILLIIWFGALALATYVIVESIGMAAYLDSETARLTMNDYEIAKEEAKSFILCMYALLVLIISVTMIFTNAINMIEKSQKK